MQSFQKIIMLIVVSFLPLLAFSQTKIAMFEQMDSLQKTNPRNIVVFIHTDWCKYCQSMKQTTFKNKKVAQKLNDDFWFIDFNAEEKRDIQFVGHTFKFKPTGRKTGIHELAEQLGTVNGKTSYPTLCILNEKYEIIFQYNQILSAEDLLRVLGGVLEK